MLREREGMGVPGVIGVPGVGAYKLECNWVKFTAGKRCTQLLSCSKTPELSHGARRAEYVCR